MKDEIRKTIQFSKNNKAVGKDRLLSENAENEIRVSTLAHDSGSR